MLNNICRVLMRTRFAILLVLLVTITFLTATPQGKAAVKTALFISQVVPAIPSQSWFQSDPIRERIQIHTPEGLRMADLYRPAGEGPYAATVFFLGVAPAGPEDPRVVNLASALARSDMVALIYWSPEKLEGNIHGPDIANLVAAFQFVQALPMVSKDRVGLAGFCVGASFALMAAAQPEVQDEIAFVNAFGPYYRLTDLARAIGTRSRFSSDSRIGWDPGTLTRNVTTNLLLNSLGSEQEAIRISESLAAGGIPSNVKFSSEGYAVYRILAGGTVNEVEEAISALPESILAHMAHLSPEKHLDGLRAPVRIMHDVHDDAVPPEESQRLAEALDQSLLVHYTEFSLFEHVTPTRPLGIIELGRELGKLFWHLYGIIRYTT